MRVLITGVRGLLGTAMTREFGTHAAARGQSNEVIALDHQELDVSDDTAVMSRVAEARPDLLINCAAYNDVDGAEREPELALRVNAFGVLTLARAAERAGAIFIHFSTDFVFDGVSGRPYTEDDAPSPRGLYAASKLLGDWFALGIPHGYVLRVESLFGEPGAGATRRGSLATIVERIRSGADVPLFVDRTVSPSYTVDIASATSAMIERRLDPGLYHCVNTGAASWAEIGQEAARIIGQPLRMKPLTLENAALAAPRPRYCALSNAKLASAGIRMPTWQDALTRYLAAPG